MNFRQLLESTNIKEISYEKLIKEIPEAADVYEGDEGYTFFYNKKEDLFFHYTPKTKLYNFVHQYGTESDKNIDKLNQTALSIVG